MARNKLRSLTSMITNDVVVTIKNSQKKKFTKKLPGRMQMYDWNAFVDKEPDIPEEESGFVVRLNVKFEDCDEPIISAAVGEKVSGEICMWINVSLSGKQQMNAVYTTLLGVIRHEIEHLTMFGSLSMAGPKCKNEKHSALRKSLHDINRRRALFSKNADKDEWLKEELIRCEDGRKGDIFSYITCYDELGPFVAGFHTQAVAERATFESIAAAYVNSFVESEQITDTHAKIALGWFKIWENDKYGKVNNQVHI